MVRWLVGMRGVQWYVTVYVTVCHGDVKALEICQREFGLTLCVPATIFEIHAMSLSGHKRSAQRPLCVFPVRLTLRGCCISWASATKGGELEVNPALRWAVFSACGSD